MPQVLLAIKIALLPASAFVFLRVMVRHAIGIKLGYTFGTDYDFLPHLVVAFVAYLLLLAEEKPLKLQFQRLNAAVALCLLAGFLGLTFGAKPFVSYQFPAFMVFWFFLCFCALFSTFFIFVPFRHFLKSERAALFFPAVLVGLSGLISVTVLEPLWDPLAFFTGKIVFFCLDLFVPHMHYEWRILAGKVGPVFYTMVSQPNMAIAIGRGCGGMQGMTLFGFLWGLLYIADHRAFKLGHWFAMGALGLGSMYLLNVLRLVLFFCVCASLFKWQGAGPIAWYAMFFFHSLLGWLMYLPAMALFVRAAYLARAKLGAALLPSRLAHYILGPGKSRLPQPT